MKDILSWDGWPHLATGLLLCLIFAVLLLEMAGLRDLAEAVATSEHIWIAIICATGLHVAGFVMKCRNK